MIRLHDVDVQCGAGWIEIIRKMIDELNGAGVVVEELVADEKKGHLRFAYSRAEPWLDVARILLLAECRSYYSCDTCGGPGEHRANAAGWRTTRCAEHRPPEPQPGRLVYDEKRRPWRQMSDGRWEYDPVSDTLLHMSSI